jgi:hypothetical protein
LESSDAAEFLCSGLIESTPKRIGHLEFEGHEYQKLGIYASIIHSPTLCSLGVQCFSEVRFSRNQTIPSITTLKIRYVGEIPLHSLLHVFPNAEFVDIEEVSFSISNPQRIKWPNLRHLNIRNCGTAFLGYLIAPKLAHLLFWDDFDDEVMSFIASHKSLESLDIEYEEGFVYPIATKAPQLRHLYIDTCEELADMTRMKLNKLTCLGIHDRRLSLELFERIVRNRFLPTKRSRRASVKADPITLDILVDSKPSKPPEWQKSELISSAHHEVSTATRGDITYIAHRFVW